MALEVKFSMKINILFLQMTSTYFDWNFLSSIGFKPTVCLINIRTSFIFYISENSNFVWLRLAQVLSLKILIYGDFSPDPISTLKPGGMTETCQEYYWPAFFFPFCKYWIKKEGIKWSKPMPQIQKWTLLLTKYRFLETNFRQLLLLEKHYMWQYECYS